MCKATWDEPFDGNDRVVVLGKWAQNSNALSAHTHASRHQ